MARSPFLLPRPADLHPLAGFGVVESFLCRLPGDYRGPASQAYLQYNADHKAWAAPLHIRISPKK